MVLFVVIICAFTQLIVSPSYGVICTNPPTQAVEAMCPYNQKLCVNYKTANWFDCAICTQVVVNPAGPFFINCENLPEGYQANSVCSPKLVPFGGGYTYDTILCATEVSCTFSDDIFWPRCIPDTEAVVLEYKKTLFETKTCTPPPILP